MNAPRTRRYPVTLLAAQPILLPQIPENILVPLYGTSKMSGKPLRAPILEPITSGVSYMAGKMTKGCIVAHICPTLTTTNSGKPSGPNSKLIGRRISRLKKS